MIGSAAIATAVADRLETLDVPIVFDPVMIATSGAVLADTAAVTAFARLMHLASLVTPNIPELAALGGRDAVLAHGCHLLAKGGHGEGEWIVDELLSPSGPVARWEARRIDTRGSHGTGCTLASGIATGLAQGMGIADAVARAIRFVRIALINAPGLGQCHGPMGHGLGLSPFDEIEG
jgi:hydroxymethylpyrimidine/phosphomethylpyrimidine kinase